MKTILLKCIGSRKTDVGFGHKFAKILNEFFHQKDSEVWALDGKDEYDSSRDCLGNICNGTTTCKVVLDKNDETVGVLETQFRHGVNFAKVMMDGKVVIEADEAHINISDEFVSFLGSIM